MKSNRSDYKTGYDIKNPVNLMFNLDNTLNCLAYFKLLYAKTFSSYSWSLDKHKEDKCQCLPLLMNFVGLEDTVAIQFMLKWRNAILKTATHTRSFGSFSCFIPFDFLLQKVKCLWWSPSSCSVHPHSSWPFSVMPPPDSSPLPNVSGKSMNLLFYFG